MKKILSSALAIFLSLAFIITTTGCLVNGNKKSSNTENDTVSSDDSTSEQTENYFTVTFDAGEIAEVSSQTVKGGETATKPQDPEDVMKGNTIYKFIGWYNGDDEFDFSTAINADIILSAKWDTEVYTSDIPINK